MKVKLLLPLLVILVATRSAHAAVFQFMTPVETRKGERLAYLWIPPEADQVRGVVVGGMTLMEREMAQDVRIRRACEDQQLAILFFKCGLKSVDVQAALKKLARNSGYSELSVAPLLFVGHSAGGPQARSKTKELGERCFGLVQYRGADPGNVDHDGKEGIPPGIPSLMMIGQFDEFGKIGRDEKGVENWEKDRDKLARFRTVDQRNLGSIVVEPGAGHFAWSDRNAAYLALFIRKAAQARIPPRWPIDAQRVVLKDIAPTSGWLTDLTIKTRGPHAPAPYESYTGQPAQAAWHFDEEMARATVAYHDGIDSQDQFIEWQDPHKVNGGARNFLTDVNWGDDGQTFAVRPVYSKTYPDQSGGRRQRWGKAGDPVGHADAPIRVKPVSGPLAAVGEHRLRIAYSELAPATEAARVTFMAYSEGDKRYRYTERVGMFSSDAFKLTAGKPQRITFPAIGKLTAGGEPVELGASSDSGLPVEYHIAYGPAKIVDGRIVTAELPRRARLPLDVKIVAYQFGRGVEPHVQAAAPVEQIVKVRKQ